VSDWREIIAAATTDRDSGSWVIARRAAEGLILAAAESEVALETAIGQLLQGQPSMAAVRNLANAAAWAAGGGAAAAGEAVRGFIARGDEATHAIAARASALLDRHHARRVVTISASSAAEEAIRRCHGPALVLESRPRLEGRALSDRLAGCGIAVTLAVDAAARVLLAEGDVVLLGADGVAPHGVSNKIGSWALAAAAHRQRLPAYALAGREKWWPQALPDAGEAERDVREVLPEPLPGVQVRNPYFEDVPLGLLAGVVTPEGLVSSRQVRAALTRWRIHPWVSQVLSPES
jgi:translation initiation factor 2B subunit (eIF-2B alpha/beta/delta family)